MVSDGQSIARGKAEADSRDPAPLHMLAADQLPVSRWRAWLTLILLGLLYLVSFVDRFILALLVEPLKHDLGVNEVQLGFLFGTAFAFFYAVLGLPLARLADRHNRRWLILAGATLWSVSTIASGFVDSFALLVALRIGLAIGEAALTPAAFSLVGDLFAAKDRRRAASIYSAFGMFGAGGGYMIGGMVIGLLAGRAENEGIGDFQLWQLVFISVGLPSLLLTFIFAAFVREPRRINSNGPGSASSAEKIADFLKARWALYSSLIIGAGLCQVPAYAIVAWMPHTLESAFGVSTANSGLTFGFVAILATVGGTLLLPQLTDRLTRRWGESATPQVSFWAVLAALAAIAVAVAVTHLFLFLLATGLGLMMLSGATNNVLVSFQHLVPAHMRATFAALCLLAITLLGLGVGPPAFAWINASLPPGTRTGVAMLVIAFMAGVPGALLLAKASRILRRR